MTLAKDIVRHMLERSVTDLDPPIKAHVRLEISAAEREAMRAWRCGRKGVAPRPPSIDRPHLGQREPNYGSVKDAQRRGLPVSSHSLHYWETGERRPSLAQYLQWCEAIGYAPIAIKVTVGER